MASVDRNNPKRGSASESTYSLMEFQDAFPDDATCLEWLWRERLSPDGETAHCPKCDKTRKFHRVKSRPSYSCDSCGHHLHPTAGTIFHKSPTSLRLWVYAIYLIAQTRIGVSAKQLERELGVTYKTAWRMFHQVRKLMDDGDLVLGGRVEVDETYIGGKRRGVRGRPPSHSNKTAAVAIVERGGRVVCRAMPEIAYGKVRMLIRRHVEPYTLIYTDEWPGYRWLREMPYAHLTIRHRDGQYVRPGTSVHTNTVENFFSIVKRGLHVYHSVGRNHLQSYLNEYAFRFNHRRDDQPMFLTLLQRTATS